MSLAVREHVQLRDHVTLGVGGAARAWLEVTEVAEVADALGWAQAHGLPLIVIGRGSNVVVADRGLEAAVLRIRATGMQVRDAGADEVLLHAEAGLEWNALVTRSVELGLSGLECLAGIPGEVGAAPVQNIGAYGQEVSEHIEAVQVVERATGSLLRLGQDHCGFGYRDSMFKGQAEDRYVIVAVELRLKRGRAPVLRYPELIRAVAQSAPPTAAAPKQASARPSPPTLEAVRSAVLGLRRSKSMLLDPSDENHRSVGSFFVNPTLGPAELEAVRERIRARLGATEAAPEHRAAADRVKLPAAWLIERAGLRKGFGEGKVGLSTRHCLAIVNRGGATASDIVAFAALVRARVAECFGVKLCVEPKLLGFEPGELAGLVT